MLTGVRRESAAVDPAAEKAKAKRRAQARASLLRQTLRWHWISAAISLMGLLLFTVTGVTLNHASAIPAQHKVTERQGELPAALRPELVRAAAAQGALPGSARDWLRDELKVRVPAGAEVEWSDQEAYVALPRAGADAWVTLAADTGEIVYEQTDRGPIAFLNDLHKGRDTGVAWRWFIDIFAAGCVVFCVTGLILLQMHAKVRVSTWPLVGLGLLIPLILALLILH